MKLGSEVNLAKLTKETASVPYRVVDAVEEMKRLENNMKNNFST